jgi:hypothetical protein
MTGAVPYYGGRFTPGQAYAAAHMPAAPPPAPPTAADPEVTREALRHLLETGVLTQAEHDELVRRMSS